MRPQPVRYLLGPRPITPRPGLLRKPRDTLGKERPVTIQTFEPGGYRFIPAVFQYSGGVAAAPGFQIERAAFREPVPLALGFQRAEALLAARGRPPTAFCACELRSPQPFSDQGFRTFNELY